MKKFTALLCVLCILFLSGCTALSGNEIMCPPKATGNKAQIQKLIDKQTSSDYVLKYPKNGLSRSSIVMNDFDNDSDEDAIAFYSDSKDDKSIHVLFIQCENEEYNIIEDIIYEASAIDRIDFANLDAKGCDEIIIGYNLNSSSLNSIDVFNFDKKINRFETAYTYTSLVTGDFNNDTCDDILLISLYSADIAAQAQLLVFNNKELAEIGCVELDPDINQVAMVSYSKISDGTYGAVIDGVSTTGDYTTQVVFFDPTRPALVNPLFTYAGYNLTRRSTQICSFDFNNDEIIDIPVCSLMPHTKDEDLNAVCREIDFTNLNADSYALSTAKSTIFCPSDGYMLTIPEKWEDCVTARYDKSTRELTIHSFEYVQNEPKLLKKLITVKAYFDEDYNKDSNPFTEFARHGSTVYTYSIGASDEFLSVSGDELASLFTPVNL